MDTTMLITVYSLQMYVKGYIPSLICVSVVADSQTRTYSESATLRRARAILNFDVL